MNKLCTKKPNILSHYIGLFFNLKKLKLGKIMYYIVVS